MADAKFEVRNMLFLDEDRRKSVKIGDDVFVVKAIFPREEKDIERRAAYEQQGMPISSFSVDGRYRFLRDATVDVAMVESPAWWKNADACPDSDVLDRLYEEIMLWTREFQEKLKKNQLNQRSPQAKVPS